ncbi:MAG: DNA polymerase II [Nanoarchaeota archaeon]
MKGFVVYSTYDIQDNKSIVQLFGRLENGQSFASVHNLQPYFFIKETDFKKAEKYLSKFTHSKTTLKTFQGNIVIKISSDLHTELNKLSSALHKLDIETYESDIKPNTRFLMDKDILGSLEIEGDFQSSERVDRIYSNPEIKPSNFTPELKILSLDIESNAQGIFCIGLHSKNYQKNFLVSTQKIENAISCKSESDCLEEFKKELIKFDPDIITGWNLIDFDLAELQKLFKKHKISFDLGRTLDNSRLRIEGNFFKSSSADISGRQVLDALSLIRDPFIKEAPSIKKAEFESYSLEDVSQAILGSGKLIKGKSRHQEIEKLYLENQKKLVEYNLMDCKLVYDILEKTKMIDLAIERSQLVGLELNRLTASIAAFDSLYIREARKIGLVSPATRYLQKDEKIMGGYVKLPEAGIYRNVAVLDFKSLYPSIITSFNIDPASFVPNPSKEDKSLIETPNHAHFKNQQGVLPQIITKLHAAREKAKKEKRELSSYAIKIIMNSFYGVLASENCRYFNFDMASSITNFAQMIIKMTADQIEKKGYQVIYSDTDSVFVITNLPKEKAIHLGKEIQNTINSYYKDYLKENYHRESFLELEFKKLYLSLAFPQIRAQGKEGNKEKAAKKRYAGLVEENGKEELEIVGLEAIRGDWTDAAQDFQRELLMKVFHEEQVEKFIKEYIAKIREGKLDAKLVYRKSIRKDLTEYTKTTPPHVKAARQLDHLDSSTISYYQTTAGPEPIQKLKHPIDYDHYIEKQISPIANQILTLLNKDFKDIQQGAKQQKLF